MIASAVVVVVALVAVAAVLVVAAAVVAVLAALAEPVAALVANLMIDSMPLVVETIVAMKIVAETVMI